MKRFAAIVTIALVVLALSAGTAFAAVCAGMKCEPKVMPCAGDTVSCPMMNGTGTMGEACGHPSDTKAPDVVAPQAQQERAVVATPLAFVPQGFALGRLVPSGKAPDARGAPHLTSVIRI